MKFSIQHFSSTWQTHSIKAFPRYVENVIRTPLHFLQNVFVVANQYMNLISRRLGWFQDGVPSSPMEVAHWVRSSSGFLTVIENQMYQQHQILLIEFREPKKEREKTSKKRVQERGRQRGADAGQCCIEGARSSAGTKGIAKWMEQRKGGRAYNCESASGIKPCD